MSDGDDLTMKAVQTSAELLVGRRLREMRTQRGLSMRALADLSGLNINTLSLIENGKSSPSVGTLQQLASSLRVPISAFFDTEQAKKQVVFTPADARPLAAFGTTQMENLAKDLGGNAIQPFVITLEPGMGSGDRLIVHTGYEFVYCLEGSVRYQVKGEEYSLKTGDSLVFESHLMHCWENTSAGTARILMILYPDDGREEAGSRHVSLDYSKKENTMKVAVITDDGKTISQHFGRAPYYLVLTVEEGKILNRELREKIGHSHFTAHGHAGEPHEHGHGHGSEGEAHQKHISMAETISDCKALICGGMGMGAHESMRRLGIQPVVTDLSDVDDAVKAYIEGKLIDHTELLH